MFRKGKRRALVAGLGLFALFLDALVPIHLAFDLSDALTAGQAQPGRAAPADPMHALLAKLVGHEQSPNRHDDDRDHHNDCAVCAAAGALAAFAAPPPAILPLPTEAAQPVAFAAFRAVPTAAPPVPYRSRAPPIG